MKTRNEFIEECKVLQKGQRCENCRWFSPNSPPHTDVGVCQFNPPVVDGGLGDAWVPETHKDRTCYNFRTGLRVLEARCLAEVKDYAGYSRRCSKLIGHEGACDASASEFP